MGRGSPGSSRKAEAQPPRPARPPGLTPPDRVLSGRCDAAVLDGGPEPPARRTGARSLRGHGGLGCEGGSRSRAGGIAVRIAWSGEADGFRRVPSRRGAARRPRLGPGAYVHVTTNETIHGVQYAEIAGRPAEHRRWSRTCRRTSSRGPFDCRPVRPHLRGGPEERRSGRGDGGRRPGRRGGT